MKIYSTSGSCTDEAQILKHSHCKVRSAGEDYENHWRDYGRITRRSGAPEIGMTLHKPRGARLLHVGIICQGGVGCAGSYSSRS